MTNKITRQNAKELGVDFNELISDFDDTSFQEHRRGSTFFTRSIIVIREQWFPEANRELDGYWETNTYISSEDDKDLNEITELNRVEKKERVVTETYWEKVESN